MQSCKCLTPRVLLVVAVIFVPLWLFFLFKQDPLSETKTVWPRAKTRVAVCFSGQLRSFAQVWPSIQRNLLDALEAPFDILMVAKSHNQALIARGIVLEYIKSREGLQDAPKLYSSVGRDPTRKLNEYGVLGLPIETFNPANHSWYTMVKGKTPGFNSSSLLGYAMQLQGLADCGTLRSRLANRPTGRSVTYTHVVKARYDAKFSTKMPPLRQLFPAQSNSNSNSNNNKEKVSTSFDAGISQNADYVIAPANQSHGGHNDKLAIATTVTMELYERQLDGFFGQGRWKPSVLCGDEGTFYLSRNRVLRLRRFQQEACLRMHLALHGTPVVTVPVDVRVQRQDGSLANT